MIRFGTLEDYRKAVNAIKQSGIEFESKESDIMKAIYPVGIVQSPRDAIVSASKYGSCWIFRYNPEYWQEETSKI